MDSFISLVLSTFVLQLANAGVPPDVVGAFVDYDDMGAIATDGSFIYQGASGGESPYVGKYLS